METIDVLIEAMNEFKGSVLAISHDQFFLSKTMKQYWAIGNSQLKILLPSLSEERLSSVLGVQNF